MITLEELSSNNINVPISYGWTNDFKATFDRIVALKSHESYKRVVFNMIQVVDISSQGKIVKKNNIVPDLAQMMASAMKEDDTTNNTIIFVLGDIIGSPAYKLYYHFAIQHMNLQASIGGNLIRTTNDLGRALGVEETKVDTKYIPPRFVIIGSIGEIPKDMNGSAFYMDCIDCKSESTDPITSGLNSNEATYINQMIKAISPDKNKKWNIISDLRKGIFSGSKVIRDISICEHADNIGGYKNVKRYYEYRKKYIAHEKGTLKISGDLFVGPPGTGKSVLLTAIPQLLGLPGYQLDVNSALGSLQGQSEQAFKEAIEKAKKLAPVVLLLDEVNKSASLAS